MKKITLALIALTFASLSSAQVLRDYTFPDASSVTANQIQITTPATPVAFDNVELIANANDPEASFSYNANGNGTGALELSAVNPNDAGKNYSWRINASNLNYDGATSFTVSFDIRRVGALVGTNLFAQVIYPLVGTDGSGTVARNNIEAQLVSEDYVNISIEIDDANFAPDEEVLLIDFGLAVGAVVDFGGTVLVDNITITKPDTNADATLSDLTLDGVTIAGFSPGTVTYDVELPTGTTTAPTVGAVATQAGNGSSAINITQAPGVPGSATVDVTAPNGTDMLTYTVNFTEEVVSPGDPTIDAGVPSFDNTDDYSSVFSSLGDAIGLVPSAFAGATQETIQINGNDTKKFTVTNPGGGAQFAFAPIDLAAGGYTHVYFDWYFVGETGSGRQINLNVQGGGANIIGIIPIADGSAANQWNSYDVALADMTNGTDPQNAISQVQFTGAGGSDPFGNIYIDNVLFYKAGALSSQDFVLSEFSVRPNPSSTTWIVKGQSQISTIEVFDILGKNVLNLRPNAMEVELDASNLKSGLYLARISSDQGTRTIKLIKN
jgi:hypothetical protein